MDTDPPWEAVFRRVRGVYRPDRRYPPKPTDADLDDAETELDFLFPDGYRAFAKTFGLGGYLMCGLPHVLPLRDPAESPSDLSSVVMATRFHRTHEWFDRWRNEDPPRHDLLRRLVVFAIDGGYHTWGFDPAVLTDAALGECRIYDVDRQEDVRLVATTFAGWVEYIGTDFRFDREDADEGEPEFPAVFKPDTDAADAIPYYPNSIFPWKERPPPDAVGRWLSHNGGAALGVARTIRDEGHRGTFGVLADALEDAGCDHRDLLEACRDGDPDIDGVWVL